MKYSVICCDPPWQCDARVSGIKFWPNGDTTHAPPYKTLAATDIIALPVGQLAAPTCALALWTTSSHLLVALECAKAWGFTYKTTMNWVKTQRDGRPMFGMGQYVRNSHELLLLCTRGACRKALKSKSEPSTIITPVTPHSQKPELFQDSLGRMWDGPYLELFARRDRPGWTCVGNESPSTPGEDIRDSLQRLHEGRPFFSAMKLLAPDGT